MNKVIILRTSIFYFKIISIFVKLWKLLAFVHALTYGFDTNFIEFERYSIRFCCVATAIKL